MAGFCARIMFLVVWQILFAACPAFALQSDDNLFPQQLQDTLRSEGYLKGLEAYKAGDYAAAFKLWKIAAKEGDAMAQCNLGACYCSGKGVTLDYRKALKWFRRSAAQGNDVAQCNIGNCYHNGQGVRQNVDEAVKWYRKAAEQGDEGAKKELKSMGYSE